MKCRLWAVLSSATPAGEGRGVANVCSLASVHGVLRAELVRVGRTYPRVRRAAWRAAVGVWRHTGSSSVGCRASDLSSPLPDRRHTAACWTVE